MCDLPTRRRRCRPTVEFIATQLLHLVITRHCTNDIMRAEGGVSVCVCVWLENYITIGNVVCGPKRALALFVRRTWQLMAHALNILLIHMSSVVLRFTIAPLKTVLFGSIKDRAVLLIIYWYRSIKVSGSTSYSGPALCITLILNVWQGLAQCSWVEYNACALSQWIYTLNGTAMFRLSQYWVRWVKLGSRSDTDRWCLLKNTICLVLNTSKL